MKKLVFFEQVYGYILRAYVNIWSKNVTIKMPKQAILACKCNFERGLRVEHSIFNGLIGYDGSLKFLEQKT